MEWYEIGLVALGLGITWFTWEYTTPATGEDPVVTENRQLKEEIASLKATIKGAHAPHFTPFPSPSMYDTYTRD